MSTSLNVVNMAVSFLAETNRSATLRRNIDNLVRSEPRVPPVGVPIEGTAFTASSLVILPPFPVPTISVGWMFFSSNILRAAGDGACVAYVFSATGAAFGASTFFSSTFGASPFGLSDFWLSTALGLAALVSIKQTTAPTATASPSDAFNVMIPLASAGNSSVALSESTSAIAWSFST